MFFGNRLKVFHDFTGKSNYIYALHLHLHLPVLYLPEVQDLIDKPQHPICIPFHHLQLLTCISRKFRIRQNILHRPRNQSQRSTQFVRNICKKAQLHICHLLFYRYFMFQTINSEQNINSRHNNQYNEKHIQEVGKRSFPERRKNLNIQYARIFRPHPVSIGRTNLKDIVSLRQVGIGCSTLLANKVPGFFKTFQNISILNFRRCRIIECSELNRENILPMG